MLTEEDKIRIEEEEKLRASISSNNTIQKHGVPALLSFFIPGLGQIVKGEVAKGILIFIGFIIGLIMLAIPGLIIWIWQLVDAYNFQPGVKFVKPGSAVKILALFILIPFVAIVALFLVNPRAKLEEKQAEIETQEKEVASDKWKEQTAGKYCLARKDKSGVYYYIPESKEEPDFEGSARVVEESEPRSKTGSNLTEEDCKEIVNFMAGPWSKEDVEKIAGGEIWTGMNALQTAYSLGPPNDQNKTVTQYGVNIQWVYGNPIYGATYVYFDGKDTENWNDWILTSWQE